MWSEAECVYSWLASGSLQVPPTQQYSRVMCTASLRLTIAEVIGCHV